MPDLEFIVERDAPGHLIATTLAGNRRIVASASSSAELHRHARAALEASLGPAHRHCHVSLVRKYDGLRHLRCQYWPCEGTMDA
jgi:hypothetical protein